MKTRTVKKLVSCLLAAALIICALPFGAFTAFADDKITLTSAGTTVNKNYLPRVGEPVISPYDFRHAFFSLLLWFKISQI